MYSPEVGACPLAAIFSVSQQQFNSKFFFAFDLQTEAEGLGLTIAATKYTCIVKIKPTSSAGQLKPTIRLGASINMLMLTPILTISQAMNAKTLETAFALDSGDVIPRASSAAGIATAKLP